MSHIPVLLHEVIESLNIKSGDVYFDATLGAGGHMSEVCKRFGNKVKLIGVDADNNALKLANETLQKNSCQTNLYQLNFRHLNEALKLSGENNADKYLFDLGMSSMQIESSGRGFSFSKDEPLLMTLGNDVKSDELTAYEIINSWSEREIAEILFKYGEEKFGRKIARNIVEARKKKKIETSGELAKIIEGAVPRRGKINPATKTFQALRIAVNDEIESLKVGIMNAWDHLSNGGRIAVISFHSLEDREVKKYFVELEKEGVGKRITKKPIVPTQSEIKDNPRSRSAKLRVIEKII